RASLRAGWNGLLLRLSRHQCAKVAGCAKPTKEEATMQSTIIAVDLAKSVFQIAVSQHPGKVAESHRLPRSKFLRFFAERKPAVVLLEACGTEPYCALPFACHGS